MKTYAWSTCVGPVAVCAPDIERARHLALKHFLKTMGSSSVLRSQYRCDIDCVKPVIIPEGSPVHTDKCLGNLDNTLTYLKEKFSGNTFLLRLQRRSPQR